MKRIAGELKSSKGFLALDLLFDSRAKGQRDRGAKGKQAQHPRADLPLSLRMSQPSW